MAEAGKGDRVVIHYTGYFEDGTPFESSQDLGPVEFVLGEDSVIPGLERTVAGMRPGETRQVSIPFTEAFGGYNPDLEVVVKKEKMPRAIQPEVGMMLQVPSNEGPPIDVTVKEVSDAGVTLDGNHPLAGKNLTLEITLIEIR